jgi:hypothetical protein
VSSLTVATPSSPRSVTMSVAPNSSAQILARLVPAHRDDPLRAELPGRHHGEQGDRAVADRRDGLARLHVRRDRTEPAGAEHVAGGQQAGHQVIRGNLGSGDQGAVGQRDPASSAWVPSAPMDSRWRHELYVARPVSKLRRVTVALLAAAGSR